MALRKSGEKTKAFFFSQYYKYNIYFFNLKIVAPVRLKDENDGFFYFCMQWPKSPKCASAVNGHL